MLIVKAPSVRRLSITHGIHLSGTKPQTKKGDTLIFQR